MTPISTAEYKVEGDEAKIKFITNDGKNIERIKLHQEGQIMEVILGEASDKTSVNLSDFSGEYHTEELSTTYYFTIIDDTLDAKHSRLSDFNLYPIKDDIFNGEARFFG
ncbi:hypothetical protein [Maribacter antarcticus]|uniref:hypothetical protein n=1 Tax=Maribacter antarcticus TaxID=505250 RepID=UPI000478B74F|nr:hypothetical protein [Maribacter antarcticus]